MTARHDKPRLSRCRRRIKIYGGIIAALLFLYLLAPVNAGYNAFGDRYGPKIYPLEVHHTLYDIGFILRCGYILKHDIFWKEEDRPWIYGMYDANHDPEVQERRFREFQKELIDWNGKRSNSNKGRLSSQTRDCDWNGRHDGGH